MAKTVHKSSRRAYINPLPGYPEKAQRADIEAKFGKIDEWYVESVNVKRADFIKHLRAGDEAIVAKMACLAKATGRIDARINDLNETRGDIHAKCCTIEDTDGWLSNSAWPAAKAAARAFLLRERNIKNASARKRNLTDAQVRRVLEVCDSKRYTNDAQRLAALKKEGIELGRTYMVTDVPRIARERGITI